MQITIFICVHNNFTPQNNTRRNSKEHYDDTKFILFVCERKVQTKFAEKIYYFFIQVNIVNQNNTQQYNSKRIRLLYLQNNRKQKYKTNWRKMQIDREYLSRSINRVEEKYFVENSCRCVIRIQ